MSDAEPRSACRVLLVRHGETQWSKTSQHTGRTDISLTERGEQDAAALVGIQERLGLVDPFVFASPRRRAQRTAELAAFDVDVTDEVFGEWDYGSYEGLTRAQIHEAGDEGWTIWTRGAPQGESIDEMTARVDRAVELVLQRLQVSDVVIFSHGHFSRSFVCRFLGWPVRQGNGIDLRPAGAALLMDFGGASERRLCTLVGPEGAAATRSSL